LWTKKNSQKKTIKTFFKSRDTKGPWNWRGITIATSEERRREKNINQKEKEREYISIKHTIQKVHYSRSDSGCFSRLLFSSFYCQQSQYNRGQLYFLLM
jgi:hypothetical protein